MKSIHSLMLGNLKRMLVAALSLAAFLLLAYTYVSYRVTESQAVNFVMSHVVSVAQAGILSQNMAEIDKDIGRFAKAWKETQDLDLRIDVFLDQKQIGHAGPLQPFERWSSTTERSLTLPSGQQLSVQLQMDLTRTILWGALLLLIFEAAIVAAFYVLMRSIKKSVLEVTGPMESTVSWLKKIASNLPDSAKVQNGEGQSKIVEIDDLGNSIKALVGQIAVMEDHLTNVGLEQARLKFAQQVAHNVKGVIATLQLKIGASLGLSAKEKSDLLECVISLQDISASLVNVKKATSRDNRPFTALSVHLLPLLNMAVLSKRSQFGGRYEISLADAQAALPCFGSVSPGEFQSVISNLIDNSVDAMVAGGRAIVSMREVDGSIEISVTDNGKGIPSHVLPHLTEENFSYGKKNGNGIGLFHAKETMEALGGAIQITSEEGTGTAVRLQFPASASDPSLVVALEIPPGITLVCVDDDSLIHQVIDLKLKSIRGQLREVVHLRSVADFQDWMKTNSHGEFGTHLYLFDYDLKDKNASGLALIEEYGLALESVLVSGLANDTKIAMEAKKLGVRRLPKDFLDLVPFGVGRPPSGWGQSFQVM